MRMTAHRRNIRDKTIRKLYQEHPDWTYELLGKFTGVSAMTAMRAVKKGQVECTCFSEENMKAPEDTPIHCPIHGIIL